MIRFSAGMVSYEKLIFGCRVLASHVINLMRINWLLGHSAHGVRVRYPIGYDVDRPPVGQGVGMLHICQRLKCSSIGLRLREPPILCCCHRRSCLGSLSHHHRRTSIGVCREQAGIGFTDCFLKLTCLVPICMKRLSDCLWASTLSFIFIIITCVLITLLIFG